MTPSPIGSRLTRLGRVGGSAAGVLVPGAFLVIFFAYPLLSVLGRGLVEGGSLNLQPVPEVLASSRFQRVAWFTLWQASLSTLITVVVGLPGAYVLARYRFRGRALINAAVTIPFVLPTVSVGAAFIALLGPRGPFGGMDLAPSVTAVLLAHVFFNYAVVVRTVGGFWSQIDPRLVDSARTLGASSVQAFRRVTLPLLAPVISGAAAIVFLFTFTSFGVVLLLAGPSRRTLEVEIYRQTVAFLDLKTAAVLVVVQMVAVAAVVGFFGHHQRRRSVTLAATNPSSSARPVRSRRDRVVVTANLVFMALLLGAPIAALVWQSVSVGGGINFDAYSALFESGRGTSRFVSPGDAVRNSLSFAIVATVIALVIGGLAARALTRRWRGRAVFDTFVMLPLGTSAVTIGFGFLIALDSPPFDLRTSPAIIPIAHALVAIPLVVRVLLPALRAIDPRLREAAMVLGASPSRAWREIDLPIIARALAVAAGFAFAISLGEFGATAFITRPEHTTLPVAIFRALGRPGAQSFGSAMALSVILMVLVGVVVLLVDRFRMRGIEEI